MQEIEIIRMLLTDTDGACTLLAKQFDRPEYSHDSLRNLVKQKKLRAFLFQNGVFTERVPDEDTRGKELLFLISDLKSLSLPRPVGRPKRQFS